MKDLRQLTMMLFVICVLAPALIGYINRVKENPNEVDEATKDLVEEFVNPENVMESVEDEISSRITDVIWVNLIWPALIIIAAFFGIKLKK